MALVVQKYGGTSVGTLDRIRAVAARALATQRRGDRVVAIVSAMSGETSRLLGLARDLAPLPDAREMDALAATGEQVSAALVAVAVQAQGGRARSLLGHQVRIHTDGAFTRARIRAVEGTRIFDALDRDEIVVVAGFQGVDDEGNVTTLGRGGSDTTAVAVAAAIGADVCEIYTDVDGVYTSDPSVCPTARKIERISYEEMLELASLGAKVLQIRSVEIAMKHAVPVHVRSSFSDAPGTLVAGEEPGLEQVVVSGVAHDAGEAKVTIRSVPDRPGVVASLFGPLAERGIPVDMIIQSGAVDGTGGTTDVTFTVARSDLERVRPLIEEVGHAVGAAGVAFDERVAKVSIVGLGMRSHAGVAARMFRILADHGVNIQAITTSEIKVSCLVAAGDGETAVRALHDGFGLGAPVGGGP